MARLHPASALVGALAVTVPFITVAFQQKTSVREFLGLTAEEKEMLSHMSIEYLDDGQGGQNKTIRFSGVDVQIRPEAESGGSSTQGATSSSRMSSTSSPSNPP